MKRKLHFLIVFVYSFFSSQTIYANTNDPNWQTIFLTPGGANTIDGVEAYFQLGECNGEDVVYVKFINRNDYYVKVEWFDGVFTQELKWINKSDEKDKRTVLIQPKKEAIGSCESTNSPNLMIKLNDFGINKNHFKRFSANYINVLVVQHD